MNLFELVFPHRCVGCDLEVASPRRRDLCRRCEASLFEIDEACCPRCALPGDDSLSCVGCRLDPPPFTRVRAALEFGGVVADAIRRAKFGRDLTTWRAVVSWAEPVLRAELTRIHEEGFRLTAVPMSSRAARRRGFDPPWIALHWMGERPVELVSKRPDRRRQASLGAPSRLENARSGFVVRGEVPERVCVFDDVITTGATLRAISEKLIEAGAREVVGLAVARTPRF